MDWPQTTEPMIAVLPRGQKRNGGLVGGDKSEDHQDLRDANPKVWTSLYGSVVTTVYGIGGIDGINENGLAAHGLYLKSTDFGKRNPSIAGVHAGLWVQYLLDMAADVNEALALMEHIQIIPIKARGFDATVHLALEDASGDSAILEFAQGKLVVHHGPEFTLMTNDPTYDEQLTLLSQQDYSKPSPDIPVPGNVKATDRFQRAAYYSALLPKAADQREAVAGVMAVMRSVSVPFGAPYPNFGFYNTEYRTICDLSTVDLRRTVRNDDKIRGDAGVTKRFMYLFELTTSPNAIWVEFKDLNFDKDSKAVAVNPYDQKLIGDVTSQLTPYSATF